MNPLANVSGSGLYEPTQRLEQGRPLDPPVGSRDSRGQQAERVEQPRSDVSVSISDAARARAAEDLASTQQVEGGNAASNVGNESRRAEPTPAAPGRLLDAVA